MLRFRWFRKKYEKVDSWYLKIIIKEFQKLFEKNLNYGNPYDFPKGDKPYKIK